MFAIRKARKMDIHTWVILLHSDEKRMVHLNSHMLPALNGQEGVNVVIFPAIENGTIDLDVSVKRLNLTISPQYLKVARRGQIACTVSHFSLWMQVVCQALPFAVILEDDAVIQENFASLVQDILREVPEDYDLVYLFTQPRQDKKNDKSLSIEGKTQIRRANPQWCTVAYIISQKGAVKLLQKFQKGITANVDTAFEEMVKRGELKAYTALNQPIRCIGQPGARPTGGKLSSNIWQSGKLNENPLQ